VESGERPPDGDPSGDGEQPPAPDPRGLPPNFSNTGRGTPSPDPTSPAPGRPAGGSDDNTRPGPTPPLRQWKQFTLLQEVGRGGFGVVYRAWDPGLSCERALKIIDMRRLPERSLEDWLREGRMLAQIRHPNVVSVHGVEVLDDEIGLCMEFVHGRTLADRLMRETELTLKETLKTGIAVCDALAAVHGAGIVHRDLKASNVMRESGGRIVLMDFGAGRERITEADGKSRLIGTPACMAPEVLKGEPATPASDVYSLGVLLFYLLTGKHPVPGTEFVDVCLAHDKGVRRGLADFRQDVPPAFTALIESALDPRPEGRPDSAAKFKQELLKLKPTHLVPVLPVQGNVSPDPIPPPPPHRHRRRPRRQRQICCAALP
jgi:serine/threonine protein kinase